MTKVAKIKCMFYIRRTLGILLFLLMPVSSYYLFEQVTGNLTSISAERAVWNIMWIFLFYLAFFIISGTSRIAVFAASLFFYLISLAETFVVSFRGTPIMIWDVLAFRTAATVAGNYVFEISQEMKDAACVLAAANLVIWFFPVRVRGWRRRLVFAVGGTGVIAVFAMHFFEEIVPASQLEINMWAMGDTYQEYGYVLSTAVSMKYMVKKPPHGYSHNRLQTIYDQIVEQEGEISTEVQTEDADLQIQPVNLICIMNESLSDLKVAGDFTTNQEYFSFINSLTENTVKGSLCVPVFGSMTSNTEYEFLTGDSVALLPASVIAYQFYVKPGASTLVSTLKEQDYRAVAMHPYPAENWNRDVCYENMGFDEFIAGDDYKGSEELRNYVSDRADYERIIEAVENKESSDEKLFVFNVTMQNHGGYGEPYENFQQQIYLTGSLRGKYPMTDQYLSLMKASDEAFRYLLEYFSQSEEPTMIVMFGDHQPSVEDEFYDEIAGRPSSEVPGPERLMWYQTPFVIWTNYEQPYRDMGKLGAVYLSSQVLDLANLEMPPYNRFLLEMAEELPVMHPIGLYEPDGTCHSWTEAESEDWIYRQRILDYECLMYNHSMDSRKLQELFEVPGGG